MIANWKHAFVSLGLVTIGLTAIGADQPLPTTNSTIGYKLSGRIIARTYKSNIRVLDSEGCAGFIVHVAENNWRLTLQETNSGVFTLISDGTNVIECFEDKDTTKSQWPIAAVAHSGGFPERGGYAGCVWLSYCSANYLDRNKELYAPWLSAHRDPRAFIYRAVVERFAQPPHLPQHATFVVQADRASMALQNPMLGIETVTAQERAQWQKSLAALHNNFRAGDYEAGTITDIGQYRIPTRFRFNVYAQIGFDFDPHLKPTNTLQFLKSNVVRTEFLGELETAEPISQMPEVPFQGRALSLADRRFRDALAGIEYILYTVTNSIPLDTNRVELTRLLAQKKLGSGLPMQPTSKTMLAWAVFSVSFALPIVLWQLHRRQTKR